MKLSELVHCRVCDARYSPGEWVRGFRTCDGLSKTSTGRFVGCSKVPNDHCPICLSHKDKTRESYRGI